MPSSKPNQLIVEGHDDKHCVVSLMCAHIHWPDGKENAPVHIEVCGSSEEILKDDLLSTFLKSRPIRALGIMLDADDNAVARYRRIRTLCLTAFPNMPETLPAGGVVESNGEAKRLGVWIMPDNVSDGYLEVFLRHLVPDQQEPLWQHAVGATGAAVDLGAPVTPAHLRKADLYTWLSWQEPPGRAPGLALLQKALDPHSGYATLFIAWFKSLYQL